MWSEKYRPKTLNEIVNQREIVSRLKTFVEEKNLPHLLFVGPAGVGKTTSILALARDLYGSLYRNFIILFYMRIIVNTIYMIINTIFLPYCNPDCSR